MLMVEVDYGTVLWVDFYPVFSPPSVRRRQRWKRESLKSNRCNKQNTVESLLTATSPQRLACVASVSVRFRSKERGTRVKDRAKNGVSKRAGRGWGRKFPSFPSPSPTFIVWLLFHFSRGQNRESRSSVFLCCGTKRKRLLRRLHNDQFFLSRRAVHTLTRL